MEITDGSGFTREHGIFQIIPPNLEKKGLSEEIR